MKLTELSKPYTDWKIKAIEKSRSLTKELMDLFPEIDTKISYSSLDENILITKTVEGNIEKEIYILKASEGGSKFDYKHELSENDDLEKIRERAWIQLDAWKYKINEKQQLKTETNG